MIGDREHDVIGAAVHGIPTIGVLHGSGSRDELVGAGARWIAEDLRALPELALRIDAGLA
jgi:phosphoglycolate phosphatase